MTIPLLEEVFSEFPSFSIQVDLKVDSPGLVEAVLGLISMHPGRRDKVLIGSFLPAVNDQIYHLDPNLPLFTSGKRALFLLACYHLGLLKYVHIYESGEWQCQSGDQGHSHARHQIPDLGAIRPHSEQICR